MGKYSGSAAPPRADHLPVTAIIPAHRHLGMLLRTIAVLKQCVPPPAEIVVHIDGGDPALVEGLTSTHPEVRLLISEILQGPGGARNLLMNAASHDWVANFDDDSFPAQQNYFARVAALVARFPATAVFSAASHSSEWRTTFIERTGIFSGCGCVFRRSQFQELGGFVSLPVAYGMEEVDLSLRLHDKSGIILHDPQLRVRHDPLPGRDRRDALISGFIFGNTLLLPFLRYPWSLMGVGFVQALSRLRWMVVRGEWWGVWHGLKIAPGYLHAHAWRRAPVSARSLLSWFKLRRRPIPVMEAKDLDCCWSDDVTCV